MDVQPGECQRWPPTRTMPQGRRSRGGGKKPRRDTVGRVMENRPRLEPVRLALRPPASASRRRTRAARSAGSGTSAIAALIAASARCTRSKCTAQFGIIGQATRPVRRIADRSDRRCRRGSTPSLREFRACDVPGSPSNVPLTVGRTSESVGYSYTLQQGGLGSPSYFLQSRLRRFALTGSPSASHNFARKCRLARASRLMTVPIGTFQLLGDLAIRTIFKVKHQHHEAKLRRQLVNRGLQRSAIDRSDRLASPPRSNPGSVRGSPRATGCVRWAILRKAFRKMAKSQPRARSASRNCPSRCWANRNTCCVKSSASCTVPVKRYAYR